MRMTVGFICYELYPETGTSARTLGFVRTLLERKHKVVIFGPSSRNLRDLEYASSIGADFVGVSSKMSQGATRSVRYASGLTRAIKQKHRKVKLDLLHFEHVTMNSVLLPFVKRVGVPIVADIQALASARDVEPGLPRPWLPWVSMSKYEALEAKYSTGILVPTEELKEALLKRHKNIKRVFVVRNCISRAETSFIAELPDKAAVNVFFHANFNLLRSKVELARIMQLQASVNRKESLMKTFVAGPGFLKRSPLQMETSLIWATLRNQWSTFSPAT